MEVAWLAIMVKMRKLYLVVVRLIYGVGDRITPRERMESFITEEGKIIYYFQAFNTSIIFPLHA